MPARLTPLDNGKSIVLEKPILLIGRHEDCDVQIDSRKISRRHCCIAELDHYLVVRDLSSTNGILVNNVKKEESRLEDGDVLTIGHLQYRVQMKAEAGKKQAGERNSGTERRQEKTVSSDESSDVHVPLEEPAREDRQD